MKIETSTVLVEEILKKIIEQKPKNRAEFNRARLLACRVLRIAQPPNRDLLQTYHNLVKKKRISTDPEIEQYMQKAAVRSQSGIAVVTSLVKPYMCPGKCVYCPTEVRMPKSYIASEPAAARSLRLDFDPYLLMQKRIEMLEKNGHQCDKIEYIIKGGTWNAYPIKYQYWYMLESFRACNDLTRNKKTKNKKERKRTTESDWTTKRLDDLIDAVEKEQRYNEHARHRIIGVTLETRPDAISAKTIAHMRQQGCTRVELGLQAPDDRILALIKRGHTVDQFRHAIFLLRTAGFKVDLHFMPDLPGTTPEHDVEMYRQIFDDPSLRPDMIKIYPNAVIPSAELYQWFLDGRYTPYGEKPLFQALLEMKLATPRYCRISRLIRDIPENEIAAGNKITNLREGLEKELQKQGKRCVCLRCREISRHPEIDQSKKQHAPTLFVDTYDTVGGTEYFITFEDPRRVAVYGFLRLRLPNTSTNLDNLKNSTCYVRELHTYGEMVAIGKRKRSASQHKGLGKKLMQEAERIAREVGYKKIAVISGVGVRGYYRKLGYRKVGTYMVKKW